MKNLLIIIFALLLCTNCRSQSLTQKRLRTLESFANSLFVSSDKPEEIISKFMTLHEATAKNKSDLAGILVAMRDSVGTLYKGQYAKKQIAFVSYKKLKSVDNAEAFIETAQKNIFALVTRRRVMMYALFEGDKILSIVTFKKGRNDPSYFYAF